MAVDDFVKSFLAKPVTVAPIGQQGGGAPLQQNRQAPVDGFVKQFMANPVTVKPVAPKVQISSVMQKYRGVFEQADDKSKQFLYKRLQTRVAMGDSKAQEQLNAIADLMKKPQVNPIQKASSGNKVFDAVQNVAQGTQNFVKDAVVTPTVNVGKALDYSQRVIPQAQQDVKSRVAQLDHADNQAETDLKKGKITRARYMQLLNSNQRDRNEATANFTSIINQAPDKNSVIADVAETGINLLTAGTGELALQGAKQAVKQVAGQGVKKAFIQGTKQSAREGAVGGLWNTATGQAENFRENGNLNANRVPLDFALGAVLSGGLTGAARLGVGGAKLVKGRKTEPLQIGPGMKTVASGDTPKLLEPGNVMAEPVAKQPAMASRKESPFTQLSDDHLTEVYARASKEADAGDKTAARVVQDVRAEIESRVAKQPTFKKPFERTEAEHIKVKHDDSSRNLQNNIAMVEREATKVQELEAQVKQMPRTRAERTPEQQQIAASYANTKQWVQKYAQALPFWKDRLEKAASGPSEVQINGHRRDYVATIKKAISKGEPVPQEIINQRPEFIKAQTARARYDKGRHTSFSNDSAAVDRSTKQDYGIKVKRQDGKPITHEQISEITQSLHDFEEVFGPVKDVLDAEDITIAHTSGKQPFMRADASALYSTKDKTVSVGHEFSFFGQKISSKSFSHELGHALDFFARSKEATKQDAELIASAKKVMNGAGDKYKIDRAMKLTKRSSTDDKENAKLLKTLVGKYWYKDDEVTARLVEQTVAYYLRRESHATKDFARMIETPGFWTEDQMDALAPRVRAMVTDMVQTTRAKHGTTAEAIREHPDAQRVIDKDPEIPMNKVKEGVKVLEQLGFSNPKDITPIKLNGKTVGGIDATPHRGDSEVLRVHHIRILPEAQGNGLGKQTVNQLFEQNPNAKRIIGNATGESRSFWKKMGANFSDDGNSAFSITRPTKAAQSAKDKLALLKQKAETTKHQDDWAAYHDELHKPKTQQSRTGQVKNENVESSQGQTDLSSDQTKSKTQTKQAQPPTQTSPGLPPKESQTGQIQKQPEKSHRSTSSNTPSTNTTDNIPQIAEDVKPLPIRNTEKVGMADKMWRSTRSIIERQGEHGKKLADLIQGSRDTAELWQAQLIKQIPTVMKLKGDDFANFVEATQERAKPANDTIKKAVAEWQATHPQIRDRAVAAGLDVGDLGKTYYPHFIDYDRIFKDTNTYNKAINHLVETGQASTQEEAIKQLGFARDKSRNRTFGNLEASREIDLPFYDKTPNSLKSYIQSASKRVAQTESFGQKDERALELITKAGAEGRDTEAMKNAFDIAAGAKKYGETPEAISRGIRQYITTTRLGLGALTNVSQNVNTGVVTGHYRTMGAALKQLDPKTREFVGDIGVISDAILNDLRSQSGFESFGESVRGKIINKITAPGFAQVEKFNRSVAATAGRDYGLRLAQKGDIKTLQRLGVKGEIVNGTLTKEQQVQIARKVVEKTQFKVDPQDLPGWVDSPGGKLVAQFRTFSYAQGKFFSNEIMKPAAKGNLLPLARLLAVMPVGYGLYEVRRRIDGRPEEDSKVRQAIEAFSKLGGAGLAVDLFRGVVPLNNKYVPTDRRVSMAVGTVGGPAVGAATQLIGGLSEAIQRKNIPDKGLDGKLAVGKTDKYTDLTSLARFAMSQVPVIGVPVKNRLLPYKKEAEGAGTTNTAADFKKQYEKDHGKANDYLSSEEKSYLDMNKTQQRAYLKAHPDKTDWASGVESKKSEHDRQTAADNLDLPKDMSDTSASTLRTVAGMSDSDRKKWLNEPGHEYEYEYAKYEKDFREGKLNSVEDFEKRTTLGKLKISSQFSKDAVELYGMSKANIQAFLAAHPDQQSVYEKAVALDAELVKTGYAKSAKFKYGLGSKGKKGRKAKKVKVRKGRKPKLVKTALPKGLASTLVKLST